MSPDKTNEESKISVADFIKNAPAELDVEVLAGANGLRHKQIVFSRIQKLGLMLARFSHYIHAGRIQIVGQSEISYLAQLESEQRVEALNNLDLDKISCVLIIGNLSVLIETAVRTHLLRDSVYLMRRKHWLKRIRQC